VSEQDKQGGVAGLDPAYRDRLALSTIRALKQVLKAESELCWKLAHEFEAYIYDSNGYPDGFEDTPGEPECACCHAARKDGHKDYCYVGNLLAASAELDKKLGGA